MDAASSEEARKNYEYDPLDLADYDYEHGDADYDPIEDSEEEDDDDDNDESYAFDEGLNGEDIQYVAVP